MKKLLPLILLPALFIGCDASIGDKCDTSNDCPPGTVCDTDSKGGYCLVSGCESDEECPENSVCVEFTKSMSYCLKKCKRNKDCRSGYTCRDDIGTQKFCYIAPEYPYGRDESNKIEYTAPTDTTDIMDNTAPADDEQQDGGSEE